MGHIQPGQRPGSEPFEADHRRIGLMTNLIADAIALGRPDLAEDLRGVLVRNLQTHFRREEQMWRQCRYPGAAAHGREHAALLSQVRSSLRHGLETGDLSVLDILRRHALSDEEAVVWLASNEDERQPLSLRA